MLSKRNLCECCCEYKAFKAMFFSMISGDNYVWNSCLSQNKIIQVISSLNTFYSLCIQHILLYLMACWPSPQVQFLACLNPASSYKGKNYRLRPSVTICGWACSGIYLLIGSKRREISWASLLPYFLWLSGSFGLGACLVRNQLNGNTHQF